MLFCDKSSEFPVRLWICGRVHKRVQINFSRLGKPTDNAYIETFNKALRTECLDTQWLGTVAAARETLAVWRKE